ncbi:MAG: hypothetical protein KBS66_07375 [Eubacterium sp.]|nr:hypothetical protein [Candidatus Colimonas fimequi]
MIYNIKEVKTACNQTLRAAFPDITVYDGDTFDGYKRPSFFTDLRTSRIKDAKYQTRHAMSFIVTYFEITHSEAHCFDVYEAIFAAFNPFVKVNKKKLIVESIDMQFIDEENDKLQVTIRFADVLELGGNSESAEIMQSVDVEIESEV